MPPLPRCAPLQRNPAGRAAVARSYKPSVGSPISRVYPDTGMRIRRRVSRGDVSPQAHRGTPAVMPLRVAVTGPTGEIGISAIEALESHPEVAQIVGMARRPFDPAERGW